MPRPYTDITLARSNKSIKNGSAITGATFTGAYSTLDTFVNVNPTILTIQSKYGNRFYNGSMVYVWNSTETESGVEGLTITPVTTNAPTNTPTPSVTTTSTPASTLTATPTNTGTPTNTATPTKSGNTTPTPTTTSTATPTPSSSTSAVEATPTPTSTLTATPTQSSIHSGINAEAASWASRVVSNGGTVSANTLNAVSDFCDAVEANNLRDRFYRLNLICGNNLAASLVPLYLSTSDSGSNIGSNVDVNYNLVSGNYTESGSSGGLSGTGFGTGIDTTISSEMFEDILNFHFACYVFGNPYAQYNASIMGSDGYFNGYRSRVGFSMPTSSANDKLRAYGIKDTSGSNYTQNGMICSVVDDGSLTVYGGSSGALVENYSASNINATASSASVYVLGLKQAGTTAPVYSIAFPAGASYYSIGRKLTSTQYNQLYTAITNFQTALGRNQ